ncbi:MAG: GNAT family N-acetyltransferase [Chloroflexota bacterium]|nr:GNAT family N-acetyltransferase [Chloroflexota bacterium]
MDVVVAQYRDVRNWLDLAAEVEHLFGSMLDSPGFYQALLGAIERRTAFCVREGDGPAGAPLMGGILFSPSSQEHPEYRIRWLSVDEKWRRHGVARLLVEHVFDFVPPPATMTVVTFGEDVVLGQPARTFYERLGFYPAEMAPRGPEGGSRLVYRHEFP